MKTAISPAPNPVTPSTQTIRRQFDRQVKAIQNDVLRMGALVEQSCGLAHQALFAQQLDVVAPLSAQDKQIDQLYRQIEVDCLRLIALQSPVASDLRFIGNLMQLIRDLERIGDYAEDLGEVALKLCSYPSLPLLKEIEHMSQVTRSMLSMSLAALSELDAESGLLMKERDDEVDAGYERVYQQLAQEQGVAGSVEPLLLMMLAIRAIERMADHATNIGQRVAYIVTGQR
jgi:phosphate transport system protein